MNNIVPTDHPRFLSLQVREHLIEKCKENVVAYAGLIAHGRGEAFDYLIGEKTPKTAIIAAQAAAAKLLLAENPVLSVNGNVAALCPDLIVKLSRITGAAMEINLFYRTRERELAIKKELENAGAVEILGLDHDFLKTIPELSSERRIVDSRGIYKADLVFVPLEDGDRTQALVKMKKYVITVDLNPLSRTARSADITIVDDVKRAMQVIVDYCLELKRHDRQYLTNIINSFDNKVNLKNSIQFINNYLSQLADNL